MPKLRDMRAVGPDYPLTGPSRNELRQPIGASADTLFRCLTDGPAWKQWAGLDVEWTSRQPFGVGTTRTVTTRRVHLEEYFVAWEEGRRMTFRFDRGTLPVGAFAEDYLCEPTGPDSSELVWSYAYDWPGPLAPVSGPLFHRIFAAGGRRALGKLAALIDERGDTWA